MLALLLGGEDVYGKYWDLLKWKEANQSQPEGIWESATPRSYVTRLETVVQVSGGFSYSGTSAAVLTADRSSFVSAISLCRPARGERIQEKCI